MCVFLSSEKPDALSKPFKPTCHVDIGTACSVLCKGTCVNVCFTSSCVGVYGEPTARKYRWPSTVRRLQYLCDIPTTWGLVYISVKEFEDIYFQRQMWCPYHSPVLIQFFTGSSRFVCRRYDAARVKYKVVDAFLHIDDKFRAFVPAGEPDVPIPRFWRWKQSFKENPVTTVILFTLFRALPVLFALYVLLRLALSLLA